MAPDRDQQPYSELSFTGLDIQHQPQEDVPAATGVLQSKDYRPVASVATLDSYELYFEPDDDYAEDIPVRGNNSSTTAHTSATKKTSDESVDDTLLQPRARTATSTTATEEVTSPDSTDAAQQVLGSTTEQESSSAYNDFSEPQDDMAFNLQELAEDWDDTPPEVPSASASIYATTPLDMQEEFPEAGKLAPDDVLGQTTTKNTQAEDTTESTESTDQDAFDDYEESENSPPDLSDMLEYKEMIDSSVSNPDEMAQWDDDELLSPINVDIDHSGFSDFNQLLTATSPSQQIKTDTTPSEEVMQSENFQANTEPEDISHESREETSANEEIQQEEFLEQAEEDATDLPKQTIERDTAGEEDILAEIPSAFSLLSEENLPEDFEEYQSPIQQEQTDEPELYERPLEPEKEVPPEWTPPEVAEEDIPPELSLDHLDQKIASMPSPDDSDEQEEAISFSGTGTEDWDNGEAWEDMINAASDEAEEEDIDTSAPDMGSIVDDFTEGGDWESIDTDTADAMSEDDEDFAGAAANADWMEGGSFQLELPPDDEEGEGYGEYDDDDIDGLAEGSGDLDVPNAEGLSQHTVEYLRTFERLRRSVPNRKEFTQATLEWLHLLRSLKNTMHDYGPIKGTKRWLSDIGEALGFGASEKTPAIGAGDEDEDDFSGADISATDFFPQTDDGSVIKSTSGTEYIVDETEESTDKNEDTWGLAPGQSAPEGEEESPFDADMPPDDMLPEDDFSFSTADMLMDDDDLGLNNIEDEFDFSSSDSEDEDNEEDFSDVPGIKGLMLRAQSFSKKWFKLLYNYIDSFANFRGNWWRYLDFLALIILTVALAQLTAYLLWYS